MTGASVIKQLCQLSLGGPAVGLAFGLVVVFWLRFIYNDDMVRLLQSKTPSMTPTHTSCLVAPWQALCASRDRPLCDVSWPSVAAAQSTGMPSHRC